MAFNPLKWLVGLCSKITWLNLVDEKQCINALVHLSTSGLWACFFACIIHVCGPWWWFSALPWAVFILYQELIADGHYARMKDGTETAAQKKDLVTDLLTKFLGMIFYVMVPILNIGA